jgi:hypothetical protein
VPETQTGRRSRRTATKAGPEEAARPRPTEGGGAPICTVAFCPICLAVTAAQGAAPDAVDHLLKAAREFFLAARAVMDARAEDLSRGGDAPTRLEKIEIA